MKSTSIFDDIVGFLSPDPLQKEAKLRAESAMLDLKLEIARKKKELKNLK